MLKNNQLSRISRLVSLDVFRGITIALMIIVNSQGNQAPYTWLEHSIWNGCSVADVVFPFFIIIVGISSVLSLTNLRAKEISRSRLIEKIFKRCVYIFCMGLLLNAFPHHFDPSSIRILGVLQRIAICYLCASILFLTTTIRVQVIIMLGLLIGYGCLLIVTDSLSIDNNIVGHIDRLVFSSAHLYTPMFDPEGLLSTVPAIASALLGNCIGVFLMTSRTKLQKFKSMLFSGLVLVFLGIVLSTILPFNKSLWSSSYVLYTSGLALLVFASIYALIEMQSVTLWSRQFELLGRYSMLVYMLHVLFLKIQAMIHMQSMDGTVVGFRIFITEALFGKFTSANAALLYSLSYTLIWLFVLLCIEKWRQLKAPERICN